jgi:hypothetical protein
MDVQDNCCGQGVMCGNNLKETVAMFAPKTCYDGLMQSKIWRTGERSHGDAHRPVAFLHLWVPLQLERDVGMVGEASQTTMLMKAKCSKNRWWRSWRGIKQVRLVKTFGHFEWQCCTTMSDEATSLTKGTEVPKLIICMEGAARTWIWV